ncbi:GTP cyclohydrolase II [Sagittula sp. NFXS13]|uniref:GTP cyclohydrolase-2 n=2 Tax=Roseobacteraceae TaxID=2854170 RepID=A0A7W6DL02_9RHOB|nr:GTP cyclohydrolase II [Sagittula marina]
MGPDLTELLARARGDLRMGVPVVLHGKDGAVLVAAAETVSEVRLAEVLALGAVDLAITGRRAETLKARAYDGDLARVIVPGRAGLEWVQGIADPSEDLAQPMKGPLASRRDGEAVMHRVAIALCKAARLLPAALVVPVRADYATGQLLTELDAVAAGPLMASLHALGHVVSARVPLRAAENARLHIFRPDDGSDEHYAIEIGRPDRSKPVLARLHSACFTGDLLGSLKCDCGPQLNAALAQMGEQGEGVLLYLQQEGRGIGLANKMRAYALQDQGFDTVEANHRLGFEDDERDFRLGAQILEKLGFSAVRLMTNNPAKIAMMTASGIDVTERVPLKVGLSAHNERYLAVKAEKSGHLL